MIGNFLLLINITDYIGDYDGIIYKVSDNAK